MSTSELAQNLVTEEREILLNIFPHGVIAMDLETTGLSPLVDKIIEISAVKVTSKGISTFSELINPEILIPEHTIKIHGITDEMVKDSQKLKDILPKFLEFAGELPMIAHNAQFDMGFLVYNLHELKLNVPACEIYCSCKFSRKVFKDSPNHKLGTIATSLGISIINQHRALDDALACLRIYAQGLIKGQELNNFKNIFDDSNVFHLDSFKNRNDFKIPKHLEALADKVKKGEMIAIKYSGGSHGRKFRPVKALSLLPLPGGNVLYAMCLISDIHKSFLLKKITDWREITEEDLALIPSKLDS